MGDDRVIQKMYEDEKLFGVSVDQIRAVQLGDNVWYDVESIAIDGDSGVVRFKCTNERNGRYVRVHAGNIVAVIER